MSFREEWKSSPICVDPQAVLGGEVWGVFETKLIILLLWTVWIHIVFRWSCLNYKIKEMIHDEHSDFFLVYIIYSTAHLLKVLFIP